MHVNKTTETTESCVFIDLLKVSMLHHYKYILYETCTQVITLQISLNAAMQ